MKQERKKRERNNSATTKTVKSSHKKPKVFYSAVTLPESGGGGINAGHSIRGWNVERWPNSSYTLWLWRIELKWKQNPLKYENYAFTSEKNEERTKWSSSNQNDLAYVVWIHARPAFALVCLHVGSPLRYRYTAPVLVVRVCVCVWECGGHRRTTMCKWISRVQ